MPKETKNAINSKTDMQCHIEPGEVLTSIEYKLSNTSGTIMRRIESITLIPPNNWPIWDGDIKFVCNDFIAGVVIIPNAATTVTVLCLGKKKMK